MLGGGVIIFFSRGGSTPLAPPLAHLWSNPFEMFTTDLQPSPGHQGQKLSVDAIISFLLPFRSIIEKYGSDQLFVNKVAQSLNFQFGENKILVSKKC